MTNKRNITIVCNSNGIARYDVVETLKCKWFPFIRYQKELDSFYDLRDAERYLERCNDPFINQT